ncbi:hypothetical protein CDAR_386471 [Caerostris darwini]|uniref:Uncharacterized protein n=1 Tax=Caerostris darwini TaxID=1538125 RepID=A0AAV4QBU5_9ARAC|nr:hypothetical protein CDAR_386471 [Caerostris darwini]
MRREPPSPPGEPRGSLVAGAKRKARLLSRTPLRKYLVQQLPDSGPSGDGVIWEEEGSCLGDWLAPPPRRLFVLSDWTDGNRKSDSRLAGTVPLSPGQIVQQQQQCLFLCGGDE